MIASHDKRRLYARSDVTGSGSAVTSLVLGLGATGLSVARWLAGRGLGARFADSRDAPAGRDVLGRLMPDAPVHTGGFDATLLDGVDRLIVSPGIPEHEPLLAVARERGLPVLSDIDLFVAEARAPVAAVTGSNGKSTVVSLLEAMCERAGVSALAGANLGRPALDLLTEPTPEFYLLELSSFQLERTDRLPARVATVLNVSPDHLDWHGSLDAYARAKYRIYRDAEAGVFNRGEPVPAGIRVPQRRVSFGADAPMPGHYGLVADAGQTWLAYGDQRLIDVAVLRLQGRHNWLNILAAMAMGDELGLPREVMLQAAAAFGGLAHRGELIAEAGGVRWVNDSKATNVGAAMAAVEASFGPLVLIAGGDAKGASFDALVDSLRGRLRAAVLLGRDGARLAGSLSALAPVQMATDMRDAVSLAARTARAGDTVLLAPACASTDMFRDYRERGEVFRLAVQEVTS